MAHLGPTKVFLKLSPCRQSHVVFTLWVYPPTTPVLPFLLMQNLPLKDIIESVNEPECVDVST